MKVKIQNSKGKVLIAVFAVLTVLAAGAGGYVLWRLNRSDVGTKPSKAANECNCTGCCCNGKRYMPDGSEGPIPWCGSVDPNNSADRKCWCDDDTPQCDPDPCPNGCSNGACVSSVGGNCRCTNPSDNHGCGSGCTFDNESVSSGNILWCGSGGIASQRSLDPSVDPNNPCISYCSGTCSSNSGWTCSDGYEPVPNSGGLTCNCNTSAGEYPSPYSQHCGTCGNPVGCCGCCKPRGQENRDVYVSGTVYCQDSGGTRYNISGVTIRLTRVTLGNTNLTTNSSGAYNGTLTGETSFGVEVVSLPSGNLPTGQPYSAMVGPTLNSSITQCTRNNNRYTSCNPSITSNHTGLDFHYTNCSLSANPSCTGINPSTFQLTSGGANQSVTFTATANGGRTNVAVENYRWYADTNCDGDTTDATDLNGTSAESITTGNSRVIQFSPVSAASSCRVEVRIKFVGIADPVAGSACVATGSLTPRCGDPCTIGGPACATGLSCLTSTGGTSGGTLLCRNPAAPSDAATANNCQLTPGEIIVDKTGPVCVERVSPNNRARFTITTSVASSDQNNEEIITKVTDTLPPGFTYVNGSTVLRINGTQVTVSDPTITTSGNVQTLVWENSNGWRINKTSNSFTLIFDALAGSDAVTGNNTNEVTVEITNGNAAHDSYTFNVAQTCNPDVGIMDSPIIYLVPAVLLILSMYAYRKEILMKIPNFSVRLKVGEMTDMFMMKYSKPKEYYEKKVENKIKKKS